MMFHKRGKCQSIIITSCMWLSRISPSLLDGDLFFTTQLSEINSPDPLASKRATKSPNANRNRNRKSFESRKCTFLITAWLSPFFYRQQRIIKNANCAVNGNGFLRLWRMRKENCDIKILIDGCFSERNRWSCAEVMSLTRISLKVTKTCKVFKNLYGFQNCINCIFVKLN